MQSIKNALNSLGCEYVSLSCDREEILNANGIILPGVGAFGHGMNELNKRNLPEILSEYIITEKPLLGICLGMQLLFEPGEEFGKNTGLGFVKGVVKKFPNNLQDKLPHISWNEIEYNQLSWSSTILDEVDNFSDMYFVHSYICYPTDKRIILSSTQYGGIEFCSSIKENNIYGCQFHPEKSASKGLKIMNNFLKIVKKSIS